MKGTHERGLHKIAVGMLFTVGNSLIRFPWRAADPKVTSLFILSGIGALLPALLLYPAFRRLFHAPLGKSRLRLSVAAVSALAVGGYALYVAWRCMGDYIAYAGEMILMERQDLFFGLGFLLCAVLLSRLPRHGIDAFALIAAIAVILSVLLLFLFGISQYRVEYLSWRLPATFDELAGDTLPLWRETVLPLVILSAYLALSNPRKGEKSLVLGTLFGYAVLFLCVLQTLLTFGVSFSSGRSYPYSHAVRVVSFGQYFFRPEIFSYGLDFAACLVRVAICLSTVKRLIGRFFPWLSLYAPIAIGAAGGLLWVLL